MSCVSKSGQAAEPVSALEARQLFAGWKRLPALVLAVSGGPDSMALLWLAARWRRALKNGPELTAVTVDHGLRPESAAEARQVKQLASSLGIVHRTARWRGDKPASGLPEAARNARYDLLARAARSLSAPAIATAHTQDDQAETVLMRLSRGSGIAGLAGMARWSKREDIALLRPLLDVPKDRLVATLRRASISYADDPTNSDAAYTRPRLRALMPALAAEGADARNLARLAARLARANAALELMTDGAERYLRASGSMPVPRADASFNLSAFLELSEELQVRLLIRALSGASQARVPELGKVEALLGLLTEAGSAGRPFKRSLAGKTVGIEKQRLVIRLAPPRRPV
ncbi:MAG: tRNA lysidine(34) synthetase TilS [Xanthobacteraceae bacterium]|nr:tRNA lysidine(34) synthetase TilS [Xanthobacteraceae bacterium]